MSNEEIERISTPGTVEIQRHTPTPKRLYMHPDGQAIVIADIVGLARKFNMVFVYLRGGHKIDLRFESSRIASEQYQLLASAADTTLTT